MTVSSQASEPEGPRCGVSEGAAGHPVRVCGTRLQPRHAALSGTTHKTVRRVVERHGRPRSVPGPVPEDNRPPAPAAPVHHGPKQTAKNRCRSYPTGLSAGNAHPGREQGRFAGSSTMWSSCRGARRCPTWRGVARRTVTALVLVRSLLRPARTRKGEGAGLRPTTTPARTLTSPAAARPGAPVALTRGQAIGSGATVAEGRNRDALVGRVSPASQADLHRPRAGRASALIPSNWTRLSRTMTDEPERARMWPPTLAGMAPPVSLVTPRPLRAQADEEAVKRSSDAGCSRRLLRCLEKVVRARDEDLGPQKTRIERGVLRTDVDAAR